MIAISFALGLRQLPAATTAWHLCTVIIPRRTITGRLVRGQVWRRHAAVTGYTKNSSHKRHTQGQPSVFGIDNVDITLSGTSTPTTASCWNRRSTRPRELEGLLTRK